MGMLFKMDPVTSPKQPAGPCEEGALKDLVKIVKTLYPLTHMSKDPDDRRPMTNCVVYTRYTGGGYLVGTDSHCLVAVKLTDSQAQFMDSEEGRASSPQAILPRMAVPRLTPRWVPRWTRP